MSKRSWTDEELVTAVVNSFSFREVIDRLGLVPAGGNYVQVQAKVKELGLANDHFRGRAWNRGKKYRIKGDQYLTTLLVKNSHYQSYKLKLRLFDAKIKQPICELCGWSQRSIDGRVPVELDHINGDHWDNRLSNLRILCPNCHSLQLTHRGKNKKARR